MSSYSNFNIILSILLTITVQFSQNCQLNAQKPTDPEAVYIEVRDLALEGKLLEAEKEAISLLNDFPIYGDAWILLARIYGWQQKYETAAKILDSIIIHDSDNMDALNARLDLASWRDEQSLAVEIVDLILSDPNNLEIHRKKESVILAMEKQDIASTALSGSADSILNTSGADIKSVEADIKSVGADIKSVEADIKSVEADIKSIEAENLRKTDLRAGYYFDSFKEPYSRFWQVWQIGAAHDMNFGKVLAGINAGNLHTDTEPAINATEFQFEAEAYTKISKADYAYLSYAYSAGKYFPSHRIFAEYWHNLHESWVVSTGLSYYYFNRNIFILSFSGEKYYHNYWFSSKVYFYLKDQGTTTSLYVNARKYFNDTDYFQLTAGTGTAPDEPFDIEIALGRLSASTIKVAYFTCLTKIIALRAGIGYSREEYAESMQRNRFDGSLSLIYSLKNRK